MTPPTTAACIAAALASDDHIDAIERGEAWAAVMAHHTCSAEWRALEFDLHDAGKVWRREALGDFIDRLCTEAQ